MMRKPPRITKDTHTNVWYIGPEGTLALLGETAIDGFQDGYTDGDPLWEPSRTTRELVHAAYLTVCVYAQKLELPVPAILLLPDDGTDNVGRFINGTENHIPLLVLYTDHLEREAKHLKREVTRTLLHELAHTAIYANQPNGTDSPEDEEVVCEDFAITRDPQLVRDFCLSL
jgi:hypothetical protein